MKDYLFYVRYNMSGLYVYHCKTDDPFHVIGEMYFRSLEAIDRCNYVEQTDSRLEFFKKENVEIREWKNKYNKNK